MKFFSCFRCESVFISNKTTGVSSSNSKLKIVKGFEELKRNPVNSMWLQEILLWRDIFTKDLDSTKTASKHNNRILYKQRKEKVIETQLQSANIFSILKNIIFLSNMKCPRVSENCKLTSSDFVGIQKELHCSDVYWCNRRPWLKEMYCVVNLLRLSPFSSSTNKISITSRTILNE